MKNTLKNDTPEAPSTEPEKANRSKGKESAPRSKKEGNKRALPPWVNDPRTRKISGIVVTFLALFLFFSALSFLFTGHHDLRLMVPGSAEEEATTREAYRNMLGFLGAHAGYLFVHKGFGLGALFVPFLMFLYGIKIWLKKSLLPLGKSTRLSLLGMLYLPLLIAFLFHEGNREEGYQLTCNDNLVGFAGKYMLDLAAYNLGGFGTFMVLLLAGAITAVFNFNAFFERLDLGGKIAALFARSPKVDAPQTSTSAEGEKPNKHVETETEIAEHGNRLKNAPLVTQPDPENDPTDDVLNEIIGLDPFAGPTISFDGEPEDDDESVPFELDAEPEDAPKNTIKESENDGDLEIEAMTEEDELTEDEIDDRVQEFGMYDPTLELSRYELPNIDLLEAHGSGAVEINKEELEANKNRIVETLNNYNIEISKIKATVGPTVTLYEIVPAPGVRISKIKNLEDDIALSLAALGIRIIAPIPGKGTIGIEVPNSNPNVVAMRSLIASDKFQNSDMDLPIAIGRTIANETFTFDLAKMPHLLMAGATGQGKSVGLNAILVSLLYKKHPSQLKFVLVDPKKVELTLFNKIERHFLAVLPGEEEAIITDTSKVVTTLNSLCVEMDDRYELLKIAHCRNIKEYNKKFIQRRLNPENGHRYLPYIVLVVDEFADLIMTAGKEVETPIARLAQLARAIGIHLIIATQRPSVNIITGTIKANFPARIAFRVTSKIDSRTILDAGGADQLIGRGDMLFSTGNDLIRIQCGFVDTPEVENITEFIGSQQGYPMAYQLPEFKSESDGDFGTFDDADRDELFEEAARMIVMHQQGSTSLLQRKLKLGYNRAGRLIDQLEAAGIIGPFEGSKARKVLISDEATLEQFLQGRQ